MSIRHVPAVPARRPPDRGRRFALLLFMVVLVPGVGDTFGQPYLYVSSRGDDRVILYDLGTRQPIGQTEARGTATQDVILGPDGNLYVSWRFGADGAVHRYSPDLEWLGAFTNGYALEDPTKLSFGPDDHLYVSQWGGEQYNVVVFDGQTGAYLRRATREVGGKNPMDHLWDDDGNLLVVNYGSRDVRRYDASGDLIEIVIPGTAFGGPVNMWYGPDDDLFIADWEHGRVLRFNHGGGVSKGVYVSGLDRVEGFAVHGMSLYLADWQAGRINRYDLATGELDETVISSGLVNPNALLVLDTTLGTSGERPAGFRDRILPNFPNPFT